MLHSGNLVYILLFPVMIRGNISVLILARGGSKGIYLKNLQQVGEITLLERSILAARSAGLNDVTVSTDNFLIALEALKSGVQVFRRSKVTATDWAPSIWGASEFLTFRPDVQILVLLQATSPFIKPIYLKAGLSKIKQFDCVFSVTRVYHLRWRDNGDRITPINFDILSRPRRQDWSGELVESGAFYLTRRNLIETGTFQNYNCSYIETPKLISLEVDTYHDLQLANVLLNSNFV